MMESTQMLMGTNPPLKITDDEIAAAEKELSELLPEELSELLGW